MKHWYVTGPRQIDVVEEEMPAAGAGEVLVRTAYTALSPGSNVHVYRTGSFSRDGAGQRGEAVYMGSGIVEVAGAGVEHVRPGDPVAMTGNGHQEYAVVPGRRVHRLPAGLSLRDASITYLSGWAVSALHLGGYAAAETVVVVGQGLVGASAALMADQMGARVLALDTAPERVAFARGLGLGLVERPDDPGAAERIAVYLAPNGPDLILETTGAWAGLRQAMDLARDYTRIALMGIYRQPPPADLALELFHQAYDFPSKLHYKKIQLIGCGYDPESIADPAPRMATREGNFAYTLAQAARGRLAIGKLVTDVVPAEQIGAILARFAEGDRSMVGVVFDWGAA
ncbi:MAG: zinc-binding dehydrogenase [Thermomicrobiales bacterium]